MMPWAGNVVTTCDFGSEENQIRKKVNEIAETGGRASHGKVTLTDGTECDHWRAGDYRIFGTYDDSNDTFSYIGSGQHTGRGNASYKVYLCAGGSTKAQTS